MAWDQESDSKQCVLIIYNISRDIWECSEKTVKSRQRKEEKQGKEEEKEKKGK